jgi:hypothetical protein
MKTKSLAVSVLAITALLVLIVSSTRAQNTTSVFPDLIQLPADFGPEGIAIGDGHTFYVGSLVPPTLGQILVGDLRTGSFSELVPPTGRFAAGMKFDSRSNYLFVAGGTSGRATVYDTTTGGEVAFYQFLPPGVPGINDVTVSRNAAYFTDTTRPFLGRVALGPRGEPGESQLIPLPANFGVRGPCTLGPGPRANGIAATDNGEYVIVVHTSEGQLYRMDTVTFGLVPIFVSGGDFAGGYALCSGDGLWLHGYTLYVAQPAFDRIAVVELEPDFLSGSLTRYITEPFTSNPATKFPTTLAEFGNSLYAVTYGDVPPTPDFVVRLSK